MASICLRRQAHHKHHEEVLKQRRPLQVAEDDRLISAISCVSNRVVVCGGKRPAQLFTAESVVGN